MDQVNLNATFRDDTFDRKKYAQFAMQLIEEHPRARGACSIAIDAPWGVGKSTFLRMWINELDLGNQKYSAWQEFDPPYESIFLGKSVLPIYYNAWENDFSDNALASILFSVCAQMEDRQQKGSFLPEDESKIINFISTCAELLTTVFVYLQTNDEVISNVGGATAGLASNSLLRIMSKYLQRKEKAPIQPSISAEYKRIQQIRDSFQDALEELAAISDGVIIFIDELDRCKPSFAIETLEAIKHYFNIPGLAFVFAADMPELAHAVGGRYGYKMNASGYLAKLFDYQMILPTPTARQMLMKDMDLIPESDNTLLDCVQEIFLACDICPREVPIIVRRANLIWKINFDVAECSRSHAPYLMVVLLLCMKAKQPERYTAFVRNTGGWNGDNWRGLHTKAYSHLLTISHCLDKSAQEVMDAAQVELGSLRFYDRKVDSRAMTRVLYNLSMKVSSETPFREAIHDLIELPLRDDEMLL